MPVEAIRRTFKPEFVNVLLVGESAPESGSFFYTGDALAAHTAEAFARVYGEERLDARRFLERFQGNEFYFDDLCLVAVERLSPPCRAEVRAHSVPDLSKRLASYAPNVVVSIVTSVAPFVAEAMQQAGLAEVPFFSLPFPSEGAEPAYIAGRAEILSNLKESGRINPTFE